MYVRHQCSPPSKNPGFVPANSSSLYSQLWPPDSPLHYTKSFQTLYHIIMESDATPDLPTCSWKMLHGDSGVRGEAQWGICQTLWSCETWWTLAIRCRWRDNGACCEATSNNLWLTHHISNWNAEDNVTGQQRSIFWSTTVCHIH